MNTSFPKTRFVPPVCLILFVCLGECSLLADEAKWPPLSKELIQRIEALPRERVVVEERGNQVAAESKSELGESHIVEHWKSLLVVLIGRGENLDRDEAEKRYEQVMDVQVLLAQAKLEGESGILSAAGLEYIRPVRMATENLIPVYVRKVMVPEPWDIDAYLEWNVRWRSETDQEDRAEDFSLSDESHPLVGQWKADPESGMFARAVITPTQFLLIWEESEARAAKEIDMSSYRVGEERIYFGPDDIGLPYLLGKNGEGMETLNFEVRSDDPDLVKTEIPLIRVEKPALSRP